MDSSVSLVSSLCTFTVTKPSVHWRCWLGGRKSIRHGKLDFHAGCSSCRPTNSVTALKAWRYTSLTIIIIIIIIISMPPITASAQRTCHSFGHLQSLHQHAGNVWLHISVLTLINISLRILCCSRYGGRGGGVGYDSRGSRYDRAGYQNSETNNGPPVGNTGQYREPSRSMSNDNWRDAKSADRDHGWGN